METVVTCNGVTDEFLWYELEVIGSQLSAALARIKRIEATVKARDQDKDVYICHLRAQISQLQQELNCAIDKQKPARKAAKRSK
jgi:hypothetical protein